LQHLLSHTKLPSTAPGCSIMTTLSAEAVFVPSFDIDSWFCRLNSKYVGNNVQACTEISTRTPASGDSKLREILQLAPDHTLIGNLLFRVRSLQKRINNQKS
jgi:hypothetical protein